MCGFEGIHLAKRRDEGGHAGVDAVFQAVARQRITVAVGVIRQVALCLQVQRPSIGRAGKEGGVKLTDKAGNAAVGDAAAILPPNPVFGLRAVFLFGTRRRKHIVEIAPIKLKADANLPEIVQAGRLVRLVLGPGQHGQQQSCKNADNGDDHQQLDKGEGGRKVES